MWNSEAKLKFAVRFSEMKLGGPRKQDGTLMTAVREGDILNLKDDLLAFLNLEPPEESGNTIIQTQVASLDDSPGAICAFPAGMPDFSPKNYTLEQLIRLQKECSRILQIAADGCGDDQVPISLKLSLRRGPESKCTFLFLTGPFRDIFLFTLFHLINAAERNSILRCPVPGCGKIFYRVRKQQFCSHACAVKASVNRKKLRDAQRPPAKSAAKNVVKSEGELLGKQRKFRMRPRQK